MTGEGLTAVARRYATAIVAVAITVVLKLVVDGLGDDHPFVLLPVPVAIAAWYGGRGPGLLAAALVAFMGAFFVGAGLPRDTGDLVALAVVTVEAVVIVAITVGLKDALRRAEASRIAADEARRELGFAVAVRDEVLSLWTEKVRGPLARLEATATDALRTLERDGYSGSATRPIRSIVDDAGLLSRLTASWRGPANPTRPDDASRK
jgi:K+-sensing histidine kinase KdpD